MELTSFHMFYIHKSKSLSLSLVHIDKRQNPLSLKNYPTKLEARFHYSLMREQQMMGDSVSCMV